MLRAFADDSGSDRDSPWFVLAGYVGSVESWDAFEPKWKAVLKRPPSIEYFKAREAESLKGEFLGVDADVRTSKIDDLISAIQAHAQQAIYIRLTQKHYEELIRGQVPVVWDNAYYFLFISFVQAAIAMERHMGHGEKVDFIFDSHEEFEKPSILQYRQLSDHPLFANCVVDIRYESEKDSIPLQAADLLAWQVRRAFSHPREPRRPQFDSARKCLRPHFSSVLSREDLIGLRDILDRQATQLGAALGTPFNLTREWKDKRLHKRKYTG